jgi:uncharacterized circularly permuted ATP-grasp superfamily protein/uncharacterized alpha-E superfamily protein
MSTTVPPAPPDYRPLAGSYDEMVDATGTPREHWTYLSGAFAQLGVPELLRRRDEAARLIDQDGVVYNAYGDSRRPGQSWLLDPVPTVLSSLEWEAIETGVIERAELLNLVLEDLYGPRELLRRGLLPPAVVFAHPGFLRQCDQMRLPGPQQLFTYAADIGRDADGRPQVLSDRAEAPSGFGYALEARAVISRVFPTLYRDSQVHRLAPFLRALRVALQNVAPPEVEDPRIVVLTPGPWNETAFEHAFLAGALGYPLVEGSDLTVRSSGVWMRSLGRLDPVHVILRRVDASWCDPLELRPASRLGVAGLTEAVRTGSVSVVNTLGSSVLENPALMAFLPRLCQHLLGGALRLPSVGTWWCGEDDGRRHVLANLEQLVIRPIARETGTSSVLGWECSAAELEHLRRMIAARPLQWVGQEPLAMAGTPTLTSAGLEPRRSVLRAFAVPRNDSYVVMPGGLTRVAPAGPRRLISSQNGAISKDTWVLASEPERLTGFWLEDGPAVAGLDPMGPIPARAAENLWWLGRYAERAEAVTRLLRAAFDRRNDFQGSATPQGVESLHALLVALTRITTTYPGFAGSGADARARLESPERELLDLVIDHARPGTLAHSVYALLDAAHAVRDQLSGDTWLVIGSLDRELVGLRGPLNDAQAAVQGALQHVMQSLLALGGLGAESMVRDLGWRFMDAGCRLERALQLLSLLRATVTDARGTATDSLLLESVLTAAESIVTYRRRYRSHGQLETLLDMLLLDDGNPRSLAFALARLTENLDALPAPREQRLREEQRLLLGASTALRLADTTALAAEDDAGHRFALDAFLADLHDRLLATAEAVDRTHFVHPPPQQPLVGAGDTRPAGAPASAAAAAAAAAAAGAR